tara:strand:- start:2329 stop:2874 length:546 start_codon:yes stop_codon:yes gene_type:complete
MIDGDSILNMQADTNIRLRVAGGSSATHDMRVDITETHFSSSVDLSSSALHFADSPSAVITSGGNTFLDNNGNIFTGGITMQADADVALNFNNNQISGSGHISGSSFYFEDSINLSGNPIITGDGNASFGQLTCFVDAKGSTNLPTDNSRATFYVDESANKFFVYVKYSGGAVKSGSIDLT